MANIVKKTAESEVKQDKNKREYKLITFGETRFVKNPFGPGEIMVPDSQSRSTRTVVYKETYLDNKMGIGYNDPIFNIKNPQAGGWALGSIETRECEPYEITGTDGTVRTVNTFTTIVFGDTDSPAFESSVRSSFKSKGHPVNGSEVVAPVELNTAHLANIQALVGE